MLWRKVKKEKKKLKRLLFDCSTSTRGVRVPYYDAYTYSLNFDQGLMWADPDFIYRSFSARFAVPSGVFHQSTEEESKNMVGA